MRDKSAEQENGRIVYADIIDRPHHRSKTRRSMSLYERAAQFSAYDALAGFYDMIAEEERTTDAALELDDNALELLNQKLQLIDELISQGDRPLVRFTVFVPDERKAGGSYREICAPVRQIDAAERSVILAEKTVRSGRWKRIPIARIVAIRGELLDHLDTVT